YNRQNYARIVREYEVRRIEAEELAEKRRAELTAGIPTLREIDEKLKDLGLGFFGAAKGGGETAETRLASLREQIVSLRAERAGLLEKNGYPADYDTAKYRCPVCSDTGWDGIEMCECIKKELRRAEYESCGIGQLTGKCSFDTFDLSYYGGNADAKKNNSLVLGYLKKYASGFSRSSPNILLMGGPGVGKTHIAVSVAGAVVDGGHETVFATAGGMISDFEYEHFHRGYDSETESKTEKYLSCELLVIDDLGTEFGSTFSVSCMYNVINSRLNDKLPTFITTNLTSESIQARYDLRIYSRLLNEYDAIYLMGGDVRGAKHV
ncbi:MAG: ATP-binding protein, partial [Clostridia bacterium]|nr:ATP-binding protein [Clostridia bacterium]